MINKVKDSYKHHLVSFILGPLLKIVEAIFDLMIPLVMKAVIDLSKFREIETIPASNKVSIRFAKVIRSFGTWIPYNQSLSDSIVALVIIIGMGIVGFGVTMITQYVAARTASYVGSEVRESMFARIMSLSKKDRENIGKNRIITVLNSDTYQVQQGVLIFIRLIVRAPFVIFGALAISLFLDWKIGLIFAAIIPLILIVIFAIMGRSSKRYFSIQEKLDNISVKTDDTVEGSKVIRAFNKQRDENNDFEIKTNDYRKSAVGVNKLVSLINPLTFAIISAATVLIAVFAGNTILESTPENAVLLATTIITEVAYLAQIFTTLVQLTNVVTILTKANVSRKRCDEILALKPSVVSDTDTHKEILDGKEIICFDNVSLRYEDTGNYALENVSFSLKKGESLGIIGGTGSGKTTIISLIERYIDASSGEVNFKGVNVKKYSLEYLRNDIGLVPQKSRLLKGTIKSNMLISKKDATDKEIIAALKDAKAYDFVSKYEDGLNHVVEENGTNFSGGQRQRLCIARALLRKPEIIILDDSTSALDLLTDKEVRNNISSNYKGITKIIISQRVSTIADCDQVLVLESGKLIASGRHEQLLQECSVYKETYVSQSKLEKE